MADEHALAALLSSLARRGYQAIGPRVRDGAVVYDVIEKLQDLSLGCPSYNRGCYGCFGPMDSTNAQALSTRLEASGMSNPEICRAFRGFNAWSWQFRQASEEREHS